MEENSVPRVPLAAPLKRLLHRLVAIGENRFQLLVTEVQEERDHILDVICLAAGVAALGLLAITAFSAAIVILVWPVAPVLTLCILGTIYGVTAMIMWGRLSALRRGQNALEATLDQLQKDRECFKNSDSL